MCSITAACQSWQGGGGRGTLHDNKVATVFYTQLSPTASALSSQVCCTCGHWWPSFISPATFAQWSRAARPAGIRVCLIYGALIGSHSAARGAGLHKLRFFAKAPNNHSISLSASVRPSGGTSHPQLLHTCHTCTLALHAPPGGTSAPEGYVYNSICVLIWKRKPLGKRLCRLLSTLTVKERN